MARVYDLGSVYSNTGASTLTTTYTAGSAFQAGGAPNLKVNWTFTTQGGTTVTAYTVKMQVTYDGTNWEDIASIRNNSTVDNKVEHAVTAPSAGTSSYEVFETTKHFGAKLGVRVAIKTTGATQAADAASATAMAG